MERYIKFMDQKTQRESAQKRESSRTVGKY